MPSELKQLEKRGFKQYSRGHQLMYDGPISLLEGKQWNILDIGFGIGFGLRRMLEEKVIFSYVGCEPDTDSCEYVYKHESVAPYISGGKVELFNCPFDKLLIDRSFNFTFCIEVVEHLPQPDFENLLKEVHRVTSETFFMSTPDKDKNKEGKYTEEELSQILMSHDFQFSVIRSQWTNLWICNPI